MEKRKTKEEFISLNELRKEIKNRECSCDSILRSSTTTGILYCLLDDMIEFLQKVKNNLKEKENVEFHSISLDDESSITISYKELESEEEFNSRVNRLYGHYLCRYEEEAKKEKELAKDRSAQWYYTKDSLPKEGPAVIAFFGKNHFEKCTYYKGSFYKNNCHYECDRYLSLPLFWTYSIY